MIERKQVFRWRCTVCQRQGEVRHGADVPQSCPSFCGQRDLHGRVLNDKTIAEEDLAEAKSQALELVKHITNPRGISIAATKLAQAVVDAAE